MKNFWIEIAKEIGVEIGKEFKYTVDDFNYSLRITENGLFLKDCDNLDKPSFDFISDFIAGVGEIELLPFEPEYYEEYWTICCDSLDIIQETWSDQCVDYYRKLQKLVFRTYEQAEKARTEYLEKLKEIGFNRW